MFNLTNFLKIISLLFEGNYLHLCNQFTGIDCIVRACLFKWIKIEPSDAKGDLLSANQCSVWSLNYTSDFCCFLLSSSFSLPPKPIWLERLLRGCEALQQRKTYVMSGKDSLICEECIVGQETCLSRGRASFIRPAEL